MVELFNLNNGYATMAYLKQNRVHTSEINLAMQNGIIEKVKPGLYKLLDFPWDENSSYIDIYRSNKKAVICLASAAEYYYLTVFNPAKVAVAIPRNSKFNKLLSLPTRIYYFSEKYYNNEIIEISSNGGKFLIYSMEKTVADLFRYRTKIGDDIVIEVLKNYLKRPERNINRLLKIAKNNGAYKAILPYLTALIV
ncbi:hypothetical protein MASR1M107_03570 [Ignavibacteriales bacterium]